MPLEVFCVLGPTVLIQRLDRQRKQQAAPATSTSELYSGSWDILQVKEPVLPLPNDSQPPVSPGTFWGLWFFLHTAVLSALKGSIEVSLVLGRASWWDSPAPHACLIHILYAGAMNTQQQDTEASFGVSGGGGESTGRGVRMACSTCLMADLTEIKVSAGKLSSHD